MKASQAATLMAGTLDIGKGEGGPLLTVCGIIFAAAMVAGHAARRALQLST